MSELKPCPFCGSDAEFTPYKNNGLTLKCKKFGCVKFNQRTLRRSLEWLKERMSEDWNRRALLVEAEPVVLQPYIEFNVGEGYGDECWRVWINVPPRAYMNPSFDERRRILLGAFDTEPEALAFIASCKPASGAEDERDVATKLLNEFCEWFHSAKPFDYVNWRTGEKEFEFEYALVTAKLPYDQSYPNWVTYGDHKVMIAKFLSDREAALASSKEGG